MPEETVTGAGDLRAGKWLFLLGVSFCLLTTSGERPSGDGALIFSVAEHIVDDGTVCAGDVRGGNTYMRADGCRVTDYGLGTSVVLVPGVALLRLAESLGMLKGAVEEPLRALLIYLIPAVLGGAIWWLFFLLSAQLSGSRRRALWLTLMLGTTTTLWFFQRTVLSEGLQTCSVLACVVALYTYRNRKRSHVVLAMGALALGVAVMAKAVLWVLAPLFVLYLLGANWKREWKSALFFLAALVPFCLLQMWFNHLRFGNILDFGYHTFRDEELGFSHSLPSAIWGYLFSPSKSFFLYNPICLAGLWGWKRFFRSHRPEALLIAGITALTVFVFGRWWSWHGDVSWGPRFLVVLVPLLSIPALYLFPKGLAGRLLPRAAVVAFVLGSFWIQFLGCFMPVWRYEAVAFESTRVSFPGYGQRLGGSAYNPMDDQLPLHHLPQFSPILGHWWLLKHYISRNPDFGDDHPWKSLRIEAWNPRGISLDYAPDWWGARKNPDGSDPSPTFVITLSLLMLLATVLCARRAFAGLKDVAG
jgi:hypothetical protein